jgi:hypothetical protein
MELGHRAALAGLPSTPRSGRRATAAGPPGHAVPAAVVAGGSGEVAEPAEPAGPVEPDELDLVLLHVLLVDGSPHKALGLSPRSVERRVHALMTRAGAASRAQLGWRATRQGWI